AVLSGYAAVKAETSFSQTNPTFMVHNIASKNLSTNQSVVLQNGADFLPPTLLSLNSSAIAVNFNQPGTTQIIGPVSLP
ncbi:MAG: hypothetical protein ACLP8B_06465, partial [Xanthobacteraceae bacterium]